MSYQTLRQWESLIDALKGAAAASGEAALPYLARAKGHLENHEEDIPLPAFKKLLKKKVCMFGLPGRLIPWPCHACASRAVCCFFVGPHPPTVFTQGVCHPVMLNSCCFR